MPPCHLFFSNVKKTRCSGDNNYSTCAWRIITLPYCSNLSICILKKIQISKKSGLRWKNNEFHQLVNIKLNRTLALDSKF